MRQADGPRQRHRDRPQTQIHHRERAEISAQVAFRVIQGASRGPACLIAGKDKRNAGLDLICESIEKIIAKKNRRNSVTAGVSVAMIDRTIDEVSKAGMDACAVPPEISASAWSIASKIASGWLSSCSFSLIKEARSVVRPIQ